MPQGEPMRDPRHGAHAARVVTVAPEPAPVAGAMPGPLAGNPLAGNWPILRADTSIAAAARTHRALLDDSSRAGNALWFDGDLQRVPHEALTMGMATILNSRTIVLMATGESKIEAVGMLLDGGVRPEVPASFLQLHPQVTVMLDAPLADLLITPR